MLPLASPDEGNGLCDTFAFIMDHPPSKKAGSLETQASDMESEVAALGVPLAPERAIRCGYIIIAANWM